MTSSTRFKLLAAAGTAALVLATVGCSNDPFAKAECSEDPDVRGSNYKYECKNGFVVKVDAVAPDVCEPLTDEEQREFCKKKGTPNVIDCKKLTATSSCGAERTIDCRKFIDFNSNKKHCGQCGNSCEFPNSFASCKQGSCQITACETGETEYRNLDGKVANGCECEVTQELCNGKDDNCDGQTDENWPSLGSDCDGSDDDQCKNGTTECSQDGTGTMCGSESPTDVKEVCDQKDNDCDGQIDETFKGRKDKPNLGKSCDGSDADSCKAGTWKCASNGNELTCKNDTKKQEVCDGADNDCDGDVDEGFQKETLYLDKDDDGHGNKQKPKKFCKNRPNDPKNHVPIKPSDPKRTKDNCDNDTNNWTSTGCTGCEDSDADNYHSKECDRYKTINGPADCNDGAPKAFPGGMEVCDGLDNDCDGQKDGFTKPCQGNSTGPCKPGFKRCKNGSFSMCLQRVEPKPEACADQTDNDCDGQTDEYEPSIDEKCNGTDDNCDGKVDKENDGSDLTKDCTGSLPQSRKGVCSSLSDKKNRQVTCSSGSYPNCGSLLPPTYTQDENPNGNPTHSDCDQKNNDCDGTTDEKCRCTYQHNKDKGVCQNATIVPGQGCQPPSSFEATENTCDNKDNDCDNKGDEGCDDDGDGWCDSNMAVTQNAAKCTGQGPKGKDCDDADKLRNPRAQEICNEKDMDCDGDAGTVKQSSPPGPGPFWCNSKYGNPSSDTLRCWKPGPRENNKGWCCEEDFGDAVCDYESDCGNGHDEDRDNKTDCDDPDCAGLWCDKGKVCKNNSCKPS